MGALAGDGRSGTSGTCSLSTPTPRAAGRPPVYAGYQATKQLEAEARPARGACPSLSVEA